MCDKKTEIFLSDDNVITTLPPLVVPTQSLGDFIFTNIQKIKDRLAQIETKTDKRSTFGDMLQHSVRTALHLADRKVTRDDVITICSKNHIDVATPYIATQFLGAKIGSVDPSFSLPEMDHLLNTVRPTVIFTQSQSVPLLEESLKNISLDAEIVVFDHKGEHTPFTDFIQPHDKEKTFKPVVVENLKDTAAIFFSSGTTGLPKGICLSHYAIVGQVLNSKVANSPDPEFRQEIAKRISLPVTHLAYTTLYWLSATAMLLGSVQDGYCRLVVEDFDGAEAWDIIEKYKPMMLMLTPVQAMEILANKREANVSSVLGVCMVGSNLSKEYLAKFLDAFPGAVLAGGYGQTEVCAIITLIKPYDKHHRQLLHQNPKKIESCGVPARGITIRVVDLETGKNLGPNQQGELQVKTPYLMNGYYNMDSSETFDDGWLKTGDILYYDEDFCFYHVDRIKEAFKYQGWFIAPVALENVLLQHPAVKMAVVIGVPKEDGHHPMGLVVLHENHEVTEEEIEKFVEARVSERQRLRAGVKFIKEVPLTPTGKMKRRELKQLVLEGRI